MVGMDGVLSRVGVTLGEERGNRDLIRILARRPRKLEVYPGGVVVVVPEGKLPAARRVVDGRVHLRGRCVRYCRDGTSVVMDARRGGSRVGGVDALGVIALTRGRTAETRQAQLLPAGDCFSCRPSNDPQEMTTDMSAVPCQVSAGPLGRPGKTRSGRPEENRYRDLVSGCRDP